MKSKLFKLFLLSLLVSAAYTLSAVGQSASTSAVVAGSEFSTARRDAFEKVWSTINEKHYDPTFNGVDWAKVKEQYLPKAQAAKSDDEFHAVLRQMLGELKLSHFGVFPTPPADAGAGDAAGLVGLDILWLDGAAVVERVEPGSSAEAAGLRTGFVIDTIDGKPLAERIKPARESLEKRNLSEASRRMYLERFIEGALSGKPGTKVTVGYLDAANKRQRAELERVAFAGEMSQPMGNFPKQPVVFESRLLEGNVGYIRFNMWVIPQMAKIRTAVRGFAGAKGLIFDLRGNPGGVGGMAGGVAGMLTDKQLDLGSMNSRSGSVSLLAFAQPDPFLGNVVIITDHGTGSTSEIFAAGMQETGRAKILGGTTAGAVLPSVFEILPTGWTFQYVIMDYRSPSKVLVEGRGVQPDIRSAATRVDLLAGRDAQLEAALRVAAGQAAK